MNTPTKTRGVGAGKAADLTYWEGAARMIASVSTSSKIVVEKSTVPVKTAEAIEKASTALPVRWEDHYFLMPFPHGADAATVSAGVPTLMQPRCSPRARIRICILLLRSCTAGCTGPSML